MTFEEVARHVGKRVIYTRPGVPGQSSGVIEAMKQLPLVRFDDGTVLQVAPNCLAPEPDTGSAASLGYGEWNRDVLF